MRYLAGVVGAALVAAFLFAFQHHLIAGERDAPVIVEPVDVDLPRMPESRPEAVKPYTPPELPPRPEPREKPPGVDNTGVTPRMPVLLDLPLPGIRGEGPVITTGIQLDGGGPDRGLSVKYPFRPNYPASALRAGIEGEVELEFTVLPDGSVANVEIVRADPPGVFEQEAVRTMLRWQFVPRQANGTPVAMRARQVIRFELPDNAQ